MERIRYYNNKGLDIAIGDVVIWDDTNISPRACRITNLWVDKGDQYLSICFDEKNTHGDSYSGHRIKYFAEKLKFISRATRKEISLQKAIDDAVASLTT